MKFVTMMLRCAPRAMRPCRTDRLTMFERLKFLSISASNLDEFFMVRVASVRDMMKAGIDRKDIAGLTPKEQLKLIIPKTHELMTSQYNTYNRSLLPALSAIGLEVITSHEKLTPEQAKAVDAESVVAARTAAIRTFFFILVSSWFPHILLKKGIEKASIAFAPKWDGHQCAIRHHADL